MSGDENDYTDIPWTFEPSDASGRAIAALTKAVVCARDFDQTFDLYNAEREQAVPMFNPEELLLPDEPLRFNGFQAEYDLNEISVDTDGSFNEKKEHFAARSNEGHYSVKYLQDSIAEQDHAENALTQMVRETKILMSLAPHPHLSTIYGITSKGIDSLLDPGRDGYFYITDRIVGTLEDRLSIWRTSYGTEPNIIDRLDTALDIASALVYLHDRKLVYYVRPDKVGFDARNGQIKLCDFGEALQHGMNEHPRLISRSMPP